VKCPQFVCNFYWEGDDLKKLHAYRRREVSPDHIPHIAPWLVEIRRSQLVPPYVYPFLFINSVRTTQRRSEEAGKLGLLKRRLSDYFEVGKG
jgi:hypothetical protein